MRIPPYIQNLPVTAIGAQAFSAHGAGAFRGNQLTSVDIPDSVTHIGGRAFEGNRLTSVNLPASLMFIGNEAFTQNWLTSLTLPDRVIAIGRHAFSAIGTRPAIAQTVIPPSVTHVGQSAFGFNVITRIERGLPPPEPPPVKDLPLEPGEFAAFPETFKAVFAMRGYIAVIGTDGSLWVLRGGELDEDTEELRIAPVRIGSASNWAYVTTGSRGENFAIRTDGSLWMWRSSIVGDMPQDLLNVPVRIGTDYNWASVSVRVDAVFAIRTDGTLWGWGTSRPPSGVWMKDDYNPIQIGIATNWVSVCAGSSQPSLAVTTDGTLWVLGQGFFGGPWRWHNPPVQIGTDTDWAQVSAGYVHNAAIKTDGSLWAWGRNWYGELGDGTTTDRQGLVRIGTDYNWAYVVTNGFGGAHVNLGHTLAVRTDGTLWAWGNNH